MGIHVRKTLGSRDGFRDLSGSRSRERARVFLGEDKIGGRGGIRTPGTVPRTLDFESSAFNRSATSPHYELALTRSEVNKEVR